MKLILPIILALTLGACTTLEQSNRISTRLVGKEFNSIASRYLDRPTFAAIERMSDKATVLRVKMSMYGSKESNLPFLQGRSAAYVAHIDKFLEWEALAKSRGDALTKDIGRVPAWSNGPSGDLKFVFHSGNAATHFLAISFCAAGTCLDNQTVYFDAASVQELRRLLLALDDGSLGKASVDSVYK